MPRKKAAKTGRPTKYDPDFCDKLLVHMKGGGTFETFGAIIGASRAAVYVWADKHQAFRDAQKQGQQLLEHWLMGLGKTIASGQLRRVVRETHVRDKAGKLVADPKGGYLTEKEYEYAPGNAAVWIFMMKNIAGWRDKRDLNLGGQPDNPTPIPMKTTTEVPTPDLEKRMDELLARVHK